MLIYIEVKHFVICNNFIIYINYNLYNLIIYINLIRNLFIRSTSQPRGARESDGGRA